MADSQTEEPVLVKTGDLRVKGGRLQERYSCRLRFYWIDVPEVSAIRDIWSMHMSLQRVLKADHYEIDIKRGKVWKRFGIQFKNPREALNVADGTGWIIRLMHIKGPKRIEIPQSEWGR